MLHWESCNAEQIGNFAQNSEFLALVKTLFSVLHYIFWKLCSNRISLSNAILDRGVWLWYLGSYFGLTYSRHNMSNTCHKHVTISLMVNWLYFNNKSHFFTFFFRYFLFKCFYFFKQIYKSTARKTRLHTSYTPAIFNNIFFRNM